MSSARWIQLLLLLSLVVLLLLSLLFLLLVPTKFTSSIKGWGQKSIIENRSIAGVVGVGEVAEVNKVCRVKLKRSIMSVKVAHRQL